MGFDCTLHVVDDASFAALEARLLDGDRGDGAFDAAFPDADELVAKTRTLLEKEPTRGARALGELALLFVSTRTPHVYCRGFALSLWTKAEMGVALPSRFSARVEAHLGRILERYPEARRHVPDAFDGNYCVGRYVPAAQIRELLAFVRKALEAKVPGERKDYEELVTVLRVAAERGLSYWEGTDLGVAQAHAEWLESPPPAGVQRHPSGFGVGLQVNAIAGARWSIHEHWVQHEVDMSASPPRVTSERDIQYGAIAWTPWGTTFARVATDAETRPYVFSTVELPLRTPVKVPFTVEETFTFGDAVLLWPGRYASSRKGLVPAVLRRSGVTKLEVPVADPAVQCLGCVGAPFGDGTALVLWSGRAYRWDGTHAPVVLGEQPLEAPDRMYSTATTSDGSVAGGFGRRLMRVYPDGRRVDGPPLDNVMSVALGPDDALIVSEGTHPEGDVLKIWWPRSGELTLVESDAVGPTDTPSLVHYDAARGNLVCEAKGAWYTTPWRALAALPRVTEARFSQQRAKLVARIEAKKKKKKKLKPK